jgi:hypothetical protein
MFRRYQCGCQMPSMWTSLSLPFSLCMVKTQRNRMKIGLWYMLSGSRTKMFWSNLLINTVLGSITSAAKWGDMPKLLDYRTVPGGWHIIVVIMLVKLGHQPKHYYASMHWIWWKEDLTSLVKGFHKPQTRVGAWWLRDSNFIVLAEEPERIMLIYVDWGRDHRKVSFPTQLLHKKLTKGMSHLTITIFV